MIYRPTVSRMKHSETEMSYEKSCCNKLTDSIPDWLLSSRYFNSIAIFLLLANLGQWLPADRQQFLQKGS